MRGKEDAHDYRYFPEPDLMPLEISEEWKNSIKLKMPELPSQKRKRYEALGLSEYDANVIVEQMETALFYDKVLLLGGDAKISNNFLMKEVTAHLKKEHITINETKLTPESFTELVKMVEKGTISNNIGKQIITTLMVEGGSAKEIVEKEGLSTISDEGALKTLVEKIVADNPNQVEQYRSGRDKLFGFFVGQAMKATQGKADPQLLNRLLKEALGQ